MDYVRLLADVRRRPNAYGIKGSYREYVAFVNGANSASEGVLLDGFSTHLAKKLGEGGNLYWALLVVRLALAPRTIRDIDEIGKSEDGEVSDLLFRELAEFLAHRAHE
ncbi:hypothetical protein H1V43_14080 [Streptomyces sp. PSKA54]|uniref:Uncharacterized protein n=1 Tax=Streptomyces himalayensis subsp. aureolus TaxID=2758039 RepID=A0A7W2HG19_9ACTN|nr:hypothetical protein [Streptomyces himalayensis]MBA4862502.1 hypothetical protein [Streptomyces himalayensis subsp. aureolus]